MKQGKFPLGKSYKQNVAVQRPTVNLKEAENVGEEAVAAARTVQMPVTFSKHGTFSADPTEHVVEKMWND